MRTWSAPGARNRWILPGVGAIALVWLAWGTGESRDAIASARIAVPARDFAPPVAANLPGLTTGLSDEEVGPAPFLPERHRRHRVLRFPASRPPDLPEGEAGRDEPRPLPPPAPAAPAGPAGPEPAFPAPDVALAGLPPVVPTLASQPILLMAQLGPEAAAGDARSEVTAASPAPPDAARAPIAPEVVDGPLGAGRIGREAPALPATAAPVAAQALLGVRGTALAPGQAELPEPAKPAKPAKPVGPEQEDAASGTEPPGLEIALDLGAPIAIGPAVGTSGFDPPGLEKALGPPLDEMSLPEQAAGHPDWRPDPKDVPAPEQLLGDGGGARGESVPTVAPSPARTTSLHPAPEPASALLLASGLAAIAALRRRARG